MALTRRCPHYGILSWEIVQKLYGGLNDNERTMVHISSKGSFLETYSIGSMQVMEG